MPTQPKQRKTSAKPDMINHPPHYTARKPEPIEVIEKADLGFHLGNCLKYLARCVFKGAFVQDLDKAAWYFERHLDHGFISFDDTFDVAGLLRKWRVKKGSPLGKMISLVFKTNSSFDITSADVAEFKALVEEYKCTLG